MRQRSQPDSATTAPAIPAPPRWAKIAARVAALLPLPSGLWRLALVIGFPAGTPTTGSSNSTSAGPGASIWSCWSCS